MAPYCKITKRMEKRPEVRRVEEEMEERSGKRAGRRGRRKGRTGLRESGSYAVKVMVWVRIPNLRLSLGGCR